MRKFFDENVLLRSDAARTLYDEVKDLPIVDYHCHLPQKDVAADAPLHGIGELWLKSDHYKWRAMRLCGVDERFITGEADYREKFLRFASICPQLAGNPLYYWAHLELKTVFGVDLPLCADTAEEIYDRADAAVKGMTTRQLLKKFGVETLVTTDDPLDGLEDNGVYDGIRVLPAFRPDKALKRDPAYLEELSALTGEDTSTLTGIKKALSKRLDYFVCKGCVLADHGFDSLPADGDFVELLRFLAGAYRERGIVMQLHFSTMRNVNSAMFARLGPDAGFDVFREPISYENLARFLDGLAAAGTLPRTVLYSLNPSATAALNALSGAFPDVRVGAAWWFNDTLEGIRRHLTETAEYAALGTNLGMLTDSRSFTSYVRFDFFRRILADTVGAWVEQGEYDAACARKLMRGVCYDNVKEFCKL